LLSIFSPDNGSGQDQTILEVAAAISPKTHNGKQVKPPVGNSGLVNALGNAETLRNNDHNGHFDSLYLRAFSQLIINIHDFDITR
jgi:hypothetical protein